MGGCRVSVKGEGKDSRRGNESIFVPPSFQGFGYPTGSHSLDFFPQRRIPQRRKMESTWEEGELYLGLDDRQEELSTAQNITANSRSPDPPCLGLQSLTMMRMGARTPTGLPTITSEIRENGLRPQIRGLLHRTYRDNRHCNPE